MACVDQSSAIYWTWLGALQIGLIKCELEKLQQSLAFKAVFVSGAAVENMERNQHLKSEFSVG